MDDIGQTISQLTQLISTVLDDMSQTQAYLAEMGDLLNYIVTMVTDVWSVAAHVNDAFGH
jgi:hypothetical protein